MEVSHITVPVLRRLLTLSEKKESLLNEIGSIDKEIVSITSGKPAAAAAPKAAATKAAAPQTAAPKAAAPQAAAPKGKPGRKPGKTGKRGKRGALKEKILALLADAGEAGARVKDIAIKLGAKPQNIHVWFSSTGKKLANVKRVDSGHYKVVGAAKAGSAPAAPVVKARRGRKPSK